MAKKKALLAILMAAAISTSVMAGCGSKNNNASSTSGKVTVSTTYQVGEMYADEIKSFQASHPNITIKQINADTAKIMAMVAAGNGPDIIRILGVQDTPSYVVRGIALNLDKYFNSSKAIKKDDMLPVEDNYRYDGKEQGKGSYYGLVKDWSLDYGLWINKRDFTAAGITIPDAKTPLTYDQIAQYAQKLTKKDASGNVTNYGYMPLSGTYTLDLALVYAQLQGAQVFTDEFKKANFDTDATKAGIKWTVDLAKTGAIQSPLNVAASGGNVMMVNYQCSILQAGYWYSGALRGGDSTMSGARKTKDDLDNFMYLPAPTWTSGGERHSPCGSATGGCIWRGTKHPDQAWTVFEWFFTGSPVDDRAKSGWGLPMWKSKMSELPQTTSFDKQAYDVCQDEIKYSTDIIQYNPYLTPSAVNSTLDKYLNPVYFGKDTIDHAVSQIDTDVNTQIKEGMDIAGVS